MIESFLTNRSQRVVLREAVSSWKFVKSGVPQGSVLGPLLFVIFINDLSNAFRNLSLLFANNTKLLSGVVKNFSIDSVQFKQMVITFKPNNIFFKFKLLQNVATLLHLKPMKKFTNIALSINMKLVLC